MTQTSAIECNDLRVKYKGAKSASVDAVRGLTFSVAPGEVVGFLGPNGAGKSSTLKAIMGFVAPTGGSCSVFGMPAGTLAAKSRIGYLPEVAMYYPYLTPLETLTLYGELQGLRGNSLRREAIELLNLVGLGSTFKKQNRQLSKGMLQRVGIAQSLLGSPELLILDEVTSGLDPVGRQELRSLLKERQSRGCTLFFSSHELGEVEMLCDRIFVIHRGQLIEERRMSELKDQLRKFQLIYRGATSMLGLSENWVELDEGIYQVRLDTKDQLLEALERVNRSRGQIVDVVAEEGSLEDYFVKTIRSVA